MCASPMQAMGHAPPVIKFDADIMTGNNILHPWSSAQAVLWIHSMQLPDVVGLLLGQVREVQAFMMRKFRSVAS